jgi:hypothetical protein
MVLKTKYYHFIKGIIQNMKAFLKQMTGFYEYTKGIYQNMTAFLKYMTGFSEYTKDINQNMTGLYEYARGIYRNMTGFHKYMTGFHKLDCTVPDAVRHIPQTALAKHNQSLREEPSSQPAHTKQPGLLFLA